MLISYRNWHITAKTGFFNDLVKFVDFNKTDTNVAFQLTIDCLLDLIEKHFKIHTKFIDMKSAKNPWINKDLLNAIEKKHRIYRKCKLGLLPFSRYRTYRNSLNKTLNLARRVYFKQQFVSTDSNLKTIWSKINRILKPTLNKKDISVKNNNVTITEPTLIARSYNSYYNTAPSQIVEQADLSSTINPTGNIEFNPNTFSLQPVTQNEIIILISELKDKSFHTAAVPNRLLQLIADPLSFHLANIFNLSIESNVYPDILKIARIVPIPKRGKSNEISNLRPISTLHPITKLFEKILFKRIYAFFEKNNLLSPEQFGFRKGKSTEHACINLLQFLTDSHSKNLSSQAVMVDLRKAFDCVPHQPLLNKLYKYGIRGGHLDLIKSYFTNRKHFTEVAKCQSDLLNLKIGVPQGSSLGPLFFLIYINDISHLNLSSKVILYADDLVLFSEDSDPSTLKRRLEADLLTLNEWLKANKLIVNSDKTKSLFFTRNLNKSNPLLFKNQHIEEVQKFKYLGLTIQTNLKFDIHISEITKKINSVNGCIFGLKYILPRFILRKIFYALVYPHLNYHILAWGGSSPTVISPVIVSVNKVIRNIDRSEMNTVDKYRNLNILTINEVYKLRLGQIMHNITHENDILLKSPDIFPSHNYSRRNPNRFKLPPTTTEVGRQSFLNNGVLLWTGLPRDVTDVEEAESFKRKLKKFMTQPPK